MPKFSRRAQDPHVFHPPHSESPDAMDARIGREITDDYRALEWDRLGPIGRRETTRGTPDLEDQDCEAWPRLGHEIVRIERLTNA